MEIKLSLALPRDEFSVPVVRRLLRDSLLVLGALEECIEDIELALTEACTNVLDHAHEGSEYEVSAGVDGDQCVLEVVDHGGRAFDGTKLGLAEADPSAEEGRGIQLMRALVDRVTFISQPRDGTVVHLEKQLFWHEDSVIHRLTAGRPGTVHGPWSRDQPRQAPH